MTYGIITRVPAPPEVYDVLHQELLRRVGARIDGLLLHVGRATGHGFEVVEVWECKEQFDTFNDTVVRVLMTELTNPQTPPAPPQIEEFDVRGLVIPRGDVLV